MDEKRFLNNYFFGQPSKPNEPIVPYESFLYIALDSDNKPKVGFTIGARNLGKEYDFVWSWTLPKPILVEKRIKDILDLFKIKNNTNIDDAQGVKYTTETFDVDLLTLIHITRLVVLAVSGHIGHVRQSKRLRKLYNVLNDNKFNYIKSLNAVYEKEEEDDDEEDEDEGDNEGKGDDNDQEDEDDDDVGQMVTNNKKILSVSDKNRKTKLKKVRPVKFLDVDNLYRDLQINLPQLHVSTAALLYPNQTVQVNPLKREYKNDTYMYLVEYDGVKLWLDERTLDKDEAKQLNIILNKPYGVKKKIRSRLEANKYFKKLPDQFKNAILDFSTVTEENEKDYINFAEILVKCADEYGKEKAVDQSSTTTDANDVVVDDSNDVGDSSSTASNAKDIEEEELISDTVISVERKANKLKDKKIKELEKENDELKKKLEKTKEWKENFRKNFGSMTANDRLFFPNGVEEMNLFKQQQPKINELKKTLDSLKENQNNWDDISKNIYLYIWQDPLDNKIGLYSRFLVVDVKKTNDNKIKFALFTATDKKSYTKIDQELQRYINYVGKGDWSPWRVLKKEEMEIFPGSLTYDDYIKWKDRRKQQSTEQNQSVEQEQKFGENDKAEENRNKDNDEVINSEGEGKQPV